MHLDRHVGKVIELVQFARVGKAISAPKRLELLDLLCQGPRTVEALAEQNRTLETCTSCHATKQAAPATPVHH